MIVDVKMRVEVDDDLDVVDIGQVVVARMKPLNARVTQLVEKFEIEVRPGRPPAARAAAAEWLRAYLGRRTVHSGQVLEDALEAGHAMKTMYRASYELGVIKDPEGGGRNCTWAMPKKAKKR